MHVPGYGTYPSCGIAATIVTPGAIRVGDDVLVLN